MKYYYIYLKALIKNRKEIRQIIHGYLSSTGELLDFKQKKLMELQKDFVTKVEYTPKINLTIDDMKNYLNDEKSVIDISKLIKEKMMSHE